MKKYIYFMIISMGTMIYGQPPSFVEIEINHKKQDKVDQEKKTEKETKSPCPKDKGN